MRVALFLHHDVWHGVSPNNAMQYDWDSNLVFGHVQLTEHDDR